MKYVWSVLLVVLSLLACQSAGPRWAGQPPQADAKLVTGLHLKDIYFNSRDEACKTPVGAVLDGTVVTFTVWVPVGALDSVSLVVVDKEIEGNQSSTNYYDRDIVEMKPVPQGWQASYSCQGIGVLGYYFILKKGQEQVWLGNNLNTVPVPHTEVKGTGGQGRFSLNGPDLPFNQTVYSPAVTMDNKWQDQVIYYIFPERFKNGNKANDPTPGKDYFYGKKPVEFHQNWNDPRPWVPGDSDGNSSDDGEWNNDFYGGDLEGVTQKLDYLKDLGVTLLYLNPIFTAPSSHKYDTANYLEVDPHFGGQAAFKTLMTEAQKRGIGVVLDTSLNHSGSDSVYMDRYAKYPGLGAFENDKEQYDSPYHSWYKFNSNRDPDKAYTAWANPSLAVLKENDDWKNFAYRKPDSVTKTWLKQGIAGWRMDVTPWKSEEFWREWRTAVKEVNPDAITYSEVWFDSSKYLLGDMYDSTMNYIFRGAALSLGRGRTVEGTRQALEMLQENYPPQAFYRLMNLTSTHDVARTMHELGYTTYGGANYASIRSRYLLIAALQFTIPGSPTIYYGDEIGLTGGDDPGCRGPFPWKEDGGSYGDWSLLEEYKKLSALRLGDKDIFTRGSLKFLSSTSHLLVYERRSLEGRAALILINNGSEAEEWALPAEWQGEVINLWDGEKVVKTGEKWRQGPASFAILVKNAEKKQK